MIVIAQQHETPEIDPLIVAKVTNHDLDFGHAVRSIACKHLGIDPEQTIQQMGEENMRQYFAYGRHVRDELRRQITARKEACSLQAANMILANYSSSSPYFAHR